MQRVLILLVLSSVAMFASVVVAQEGNVTRTSLGTPLSSPTGEPPAYDEASGWSNNSEFNNPHWTASYSQWLSNDPWTAVFTQNRTNAGLNVSANKLKFDLNGKTYEVSAYPTGGGSGVEGHSSIYDAAGMGSYLHVTNGRLDFSPQITSKNFVNIGRYGSAGQLIVDEATVNTTKLNVGAEANSNGAIILNEGGRITNDDNSGKLFLGTHSHGGVYLNGAGAELSIGEVQIGSKTGEPAAFGEIVVNHADAVLTVGRPEGLSHNLYINNLAATSLRENIGLKVLAGRAIVHHDLELALGPVGSSWYGAVVIGGGTLEVGGKIHFGAASATNYFSGGRIFLDQGELILAAPSSLEIGDSNQFIWQDGTIRYRGDTVITNDKIYTMTDFGARRYGGDRALGSLGASQSIRSEGKLTLAKKVGDSKSLLLSGGTYGASNGIQVDADLRGYGTLDGTLSGTGTIESTTAGKTIQIGALGGENALLGAGNFNIGHLDVDATHNGTISGAGALTKVGIGSQTFTGSVERLAGIDVQEGALVFSGANAQLTTSQLQVGAAGELRFGSAATGNVSGPTTNAGVIEIESGGTLNFGGDVENVGHIVNNGIVNGTLVGTGRFSGDGTYLGEVELSRGATLAPGNSPGDVTFENLLIEAGAILEMEIAAAVGTAGVDWDHISVTDTLTITATVGDPISIVLKSLEGVITPAMLSAMVPGEQIRWRFISATIADPNSFSPDLFLIDVSQFSDADAKSQGHFATEVHVNGIDMVYTLDAVEAPEPGAIWLTAGVVLALGTRRFMASRRKCTAVSA